MRRASSAPFIVDDPLILTLAGPGAGAICGEKVENILYADAPFENESVTCIEGTLEKGKEIESESKFTA